jgi:replicative DNA helicase
MAKQLDENDRWQADPASFNRDPAAGCKPYPRAAKVAPDASAVPSEPPPSGARPKPAAEAPLPFDVPSTLPRFPVEALPPEIRAFVWAVASTLEVCPDLPAMLSLAALAAALQGKAKVRPWGDWHEPLNLYMVVALEPGEMKSAAFKAIFGPLYKHESQRRAKWKDEMKAAKARGEEDEDGEDGEPPPCPRMFVDDATPEALARVMAEQGETITVASDEGTAFELMTGTYSDKPNNGIFLHGHDGGRVTIDRRGPGGSVVLREPKITFALAVQLRIMRELNRPELRGKGMLARFFYGFPTSKTGEHTFPGGRIDPMVRTPYEAKLLELAASERPEGSDELVLSLTAEAAELLRREAVKLDRRCGFGGDLSGMKDWASKWRGLVARIAGLIYMAEHPQHEGMIDVPTVDRALAIGAYALEHARHALEHAMTTDPAEERARLLLESLQDAAAWRGRPGVTWPRITKRSVQQFVRSLRKGPDAQAALDQLAERGFLALERGEKGKADRYLVVGAEG